MMHEKLRIIGWGAVVLVGSIFVVLFFITLRQPKSAQRFSLHPTFSTHRRTPVEVKDVVYIGPWMTFDYVNKLFLLPDDYLKQSLQVTNSKYPFITLGRYAREMNINNDELIKNIRSDIEEYLMSSSTHQ